MATDLTNDGSGGLPTPGESPELARSLSLLDRAKAKRAERETHLFLEVPSWDGDLVAEYRVLGSKELEVISDNVTRKIRAGEADQIRADLEVIAKSNVALHMVDPETGDRVTLEDEGGPIGYDRVALLFNMEDQLTSVFKTIQYLTGERKEDGAPGEWQENPTAISQHANRIARWMRDPSKSGIGVLEELLGES